MHLSILRLHYCRGASNNVELVRDANVIFNQSSIESVSLDCSLQMTRALWFHPQPLSTQSRLSTTLIILQ
jgi:hypothetical protein